MIDRLQPKVVDRGSSLCTLAEEDPPKMVKAGTSQWRTLLGSRTVVDYFIVDQRIVSCYER